MTGGWQSIAIINSRMQRGRTNAVQSAVRSQDCRWHRLAQTQLNLLHSLQADSIKLNPFHIQFTRYLYVNSLRTWSERSEPCIERYCINLYLIPQVTLLYVYTLILAMWHCATNRKIAGSIPDGVIEIFFIDIILPTALWPWDKLSLWQKWVPGIFPEG